MAATLVLLVVCVCVWVGGGGLWPLNFLKLYS